MEIMPLARIQGVDTVVLDEVAVPQAGSGDVVVRVAYCGICGSDLGHLASGGIPGRAGPLALGHEFSGTVHAVGGNVAELQAADRVVVNPLAGILSITHGIRAALLGEFPASTVFVEAPVELPVQLLLARELAKDSARSAKVMVDCQG